MDKSVLTSNQEVKVLFVAYMTLYCYFFFRLTESNKLGLQHVIGCWSAVCSRLIPRCSF